MLKKRLRISQNCFLWAIVDSNFWICKSLNSIFETITHIWARSHPSLLSPLPCNGLSYPAYTLSLSTAPPIWHTPHSIDDSSNSSPMWHERCDLYPDLQSSVARVYSTCIYYLQSSACSYMWNEYRHTFLLSHNHTVVQCGTDVLQNGSLTTVAGSGHHYIALIKAKDGLVIYIIQSHI